MHSLANEMLKTTYEVQHGQLVQEWILREKKECVKHDHFKFKHNFWVLSISLSFHCHFLAKLTSRHNSHPSESLGKRPLSCTTPNLI